ncbi:MAG: diguanylate cyclase [Planctomycetota bacterium]
MLAIRDLRHRVQQSLTTNSVGWEERLLALDPLTVLRCMRMAHSPVYGSGRELLTIPQLRRTLGRAMVRRALNTPACDIAGTEPIRRLWLHAVATAHAARSLAEASGEYDPEKAYVLGLLHDLPLWLHYLSLRRTGVAPSAGVRGWITHWHLPEELREVVEQIMLGMGQTPPLVTSSGSASVIAAAELLAELADFWHPDDGDQLSRNLLLSVVTKDDLVAAHNLRQDVIAALETVGLNQSPLEPEQAEALPTHSLSLFRVHAQGDVADLVLSLLSCNDSSHYRGVVTATTSAALRYLGFERAYAVQWSAEHDACYVRAKADLSPRSLTPTRLEPTEPERELMARAVATGEAQHLVNDRNAGEGLLHLLGADDVLITPINCDFRIPTFLVMDRALSGSPIRLSQDRAGAQALAGTASILTENLLLKKQRARAQKFSLTDPLTRLYNRSVGISSLGQEIARANRSGDPFTVLMLDMDDFKRLNDTRGHLAGDQALRATADVLRKTLRKSDIVCRYGGEEFLVVLPATSVEEASISATRIFTAVEQAGDALSLPLTISVGLALVRADDDVESVLSRADRALYASKLRGRNRFSVDGE